MNATTKSAMEEYGDYLFKGSIILFIAFTPIYIALTEVMFWLILVGYVVHKVGVGKPLLRTTGVGIAMLAFVAALVFTSFFSIKPLHSLAAIGAFRFFLLYIMLANYEMQEDFASHLANLILYMAVVWSGVEIIKYFRANALRLDVFTAHINTLVIPMVVGPLIMVPMGRIKRGIIRVIPLHSFDSKLPESVTGCMVGDACRYNSPVVLLELEDTVAFGIAGNNNGVFCGVILSTLFCREGHKQHGQALPTGR